VTIDPHPRHKLMHTDSLDSGQTPTCLPSTDSPKCNVVFELFLSLFFKLRPYYDSNEGRTIFGF